MCDEALLPAPSHAGLSGCVQLQLGDSQHPSSHCIWFLMTDRIGLRVHSRAQTHSSMQAVSVSGSGVSAFHTVCVHITPYNLQTNMHTLVSGGPKSRWNWQKLSRQLSVTSKRDAVISTQVKGHWPASLKWTDLKACESGGSITVDPCFCSFSYYNIKCSFPHPAFLSAITPMWDIYLMSTSLLLLFHFLFIQRQNWFT